MQVPVLVGILSTLLSSDLVTANTLAEKFEMSTRSVYRYVNALSEAGIPISAKQGRNGGWSIVDTYKLKSMYFTKDEYARMIFSIKSFNVQDSLTRDIVDKLSGMMSNAYDSIVLQSNQLIVDTVGNERLQSRLEVLQKALNTNRLVTMEYHAKKGEVTTRTIEPCSLVLKNGEWYIYAFCQLRQGFRFFKIARIAKLGLEKTKFTPRKFTVDCSVIETDMIKGKEKCDLLLTVKPYALTAVEEWVGIGQVARVGEEYIARASLPYDDVLIDKILSFGSGVRVEKPLSLAEDVKKRCLDIMANYNDNNV